MLTDYLYYLLKTKMIELLKYYLPNVEIKDYNVLIDGNAFFELPIKYRRNLRKNYSNNRPQWLLHKR